MNNKAADFEQLMQLAGAFRGSKVLLAACKLDLFSHLTAQSMRAEELSAMLGFNSRALSILMDALVALNLLNKHDGRYSNTPLTAVYLDKASPTYHGHILRHLDNCWESWTDLAQVVQRGSQAGKFRQSFSGDQEEYNREFIWGMDDLGQDRALEIHKHLNLSGVKRMLDLGGGAATYSIAFVKQYPGLQSTVIDLPLTLKVAQENINRHKVQSAVTVKAGDFHQVELGEDYNLVWISQILHSQGEAECSQLIEKAYQSLAKEGRLIIHDFLINEDRTSPAKSALFAVHMLAGTASGRVYTPGEITAWLEAAGFVEVGVKQIRDDGMLVEGKKTK